MRVLGNYYDFAIIECQCAVDFLSFAELGNLFFIVFRKSIECSIVESCSEKKKISLVISRVSESRCYVETVEIITLHILRRKKKWSKWRPWYSSSWMTQLGTNRSSNDTTLLMWEKNYAKIEGAEGSPDFQGTGEIVLPLPRRFFPVIGDQHRNGYTLDGENTKGE